MIEIVVEVVRSAGTNDYFITSVWPGFILFKGNVLSIPEALVMMILSPVSLVYKFRGAQNHSGARRPA